MALDLQPYDDREQGLPTNGPTLGPTVALELCPSDLQAAGGGADPAQERDADSPSPRRAGADRSSDSRLAELALATLKQNALLPTGKIRAVVRNAWLILEGEIEARAQRQAVEDAVRGLPGIRGMSNNILIESEIMAQRVSRRIDEAFISNARLSASRISVSACNNKIILSGSVRSGVEREEAESAAWGAPGVAEVVNRIRTTG